MNGHQYKLQRNSQFNISAMNLVYNRTVIVSFQGHKIWNILQDRLKEIDSIGAFKMAIKSKMPEKCSCRFCSINIHNVNFIYKNLNSFK